MFKASLSLIGFGGLFFINIGLAYDYH